MRANYRKYEGGWAWLSWAIPAAASVLGALTGSNEGKKNREAQYDFAQHGIEWKVKDAERAGVHPVYALGASTPSYSPVTSGAPEMIAGAGQQIGKGIRDRRLDDIQKELAAAQITKDYAQATMYANEAARIKQAGNSGGGQYVAPPDVVVGAYRGTRRIEEHPLYQDAVKLEPDTMVSRDAGLAGQTSGRNHPSMREFQLPNGDSLLLPATGQGGIPEEIDMMMLPEIIGANINRYGSRQAVLGALYRWFGTRLIDDEIRGPSVTGKIRY